MSDDDESAFDASDASDDSGSASFDDDESDGDDWDTLEKKAAKCMTRSPLSFVFG